MLTGKLGPYKLVKKIAVGGMAEIYQATVADTEPVRQVAIKVIHPNNSEDPDFIRMLLDEARLAVRLKHPNIVTTYDLGKEDAQYYLVMELVEGTDLFRLEQRANELHLSMPIALGAYITKEVLRGLHFAHELSDPEGHPLHVVHRDVSPQNVLLSYDGAVKLTDFGIAKAEGRAEQTQLGIIKGKYYYMSPEQASGERLDRRTDIFAAGILLYELLAGEMLYFDQNIERLLEKVRRAEIPHIVKRRPETPHELEKILLRALKRRPEDRYRTAEDMAQALETFLRRYAPTFSSSELGQFVERVQKSPVKKRTADEPTAALSAEQAQRLGIALGEVKDTPSPTAGIDGEALERLRVLGVRDDNSLLFQSGKLRALLEQPSRSRDNLQPLHFGSSRPDTSSPENDDEPDSADRSDVTTHRRISNRFAEPATPKAVFLAITPETEQAGLLAEGPSFLLKPVELGRAAAARARLESSALYPRDEDGGVGDGVTAVAQLEDLSLAASKRSRRSLSRPSRSPARPRLSEPKLELLQSDPPDENHVPGQPAVELAQSDDYSPVSGAPSSLSDRAQPISLLAEPSGQVDIISTEITHDALSAHLQDGEGPAPPVEPVSTPKSRVLFVVAGMVAALISALATWFFVLFPKQSGLVLPTPADLTQSADLFEKEPQDAGANTPDAAVAKRVAPDPERPATPPKTVAEKQKPGPGQVLIRSEPPGARVLQDKQEIGVTPLLLDRPPGEDFKIELLLDGYKKGRKRVKWREKDRLEIKVKLRSLADQTEGTENEP